ncbi:FAD-binding protein [Candidatus Poribacteria bacterium]|nr:FAD-binding protein [Candidatus Poribacteria bacterium]
MYDLLIIGGGSAGMTSAVYAARKQMKTLLISKDLGGQLLWTSDIENYMGYQYITGRELTDKFKAQMQQFPIVDIITGINVEKISRQDNLFLALTENGKSYRGKTIIIATGKRYRPLNVPGEKELVGKGISYCATCDAPLYKGKDVAVIGGGNSGITSVIDLRNISNNIYVINNSNVWQADPVLIERIKDAENFIPMLSHNVLAIHGKDSVTGITVQSIKTGEQKTLDIQGVFIEIGLLPNSELVKEIISLTDLGEIMVDCGCRTAVPGLFGAGDVTTVPEKQIGVAIGEGIKASLSAYKYLLRMT